MASDGSLYYLARGGGECVSSAVHRELGAEHHVASANVTVSAGQSASFTVAASGTAPLRYQWQRNGANIASATSATYTLQSTTAADNGAAFRAVVSNDFGSATSNAATLTVLSNSAPTGSISSPTAGTRYRGGQTFTFAGTGSDLEDGALPPSAFTWRVDFHHDDHSHPHVAPTSGITSGTFRIANRGETSANVFYRLILTVRDSAGLTHTSSVDVLPLTSVVRIESNVPNAQLTLDGAPITAPFTFTGVEGVIRTLGAVSPQTSGSTTYDFASWSDGGAQTHEIATPTDDTTFTALFQPAAPTQLFTDNFETAKGWALTSGANTATTGRWQRGDPQPTSTQGTALQPGACSGWVRELSGHRAERRHNGGKRTTSIAGMTTIAIAGDRAAGRQYHHSAVSATSSPTSPTRRARTSSVCESSRRTVHHKPVHARGTASKRPGAWTSQSVNLSSYAGQSVRIRFEALDKGANSLIEAGVDDVVITRQ